MFDEKSYSAQQSRPNTWRAPPRYRKSDVAWWVFWISGLAALIYLSTLR